MDPNRLDEILGDLKRNHPIVAAVACACATPIGAFDRWMRLPRFVGGTESGCTSTRRTAVVLV
jgi:hypothetical protein